MSSIPKTSKGDSRNMLGSIDLLAEQVRHAWESSSNFVLPETYRQCDKVVLFGMGGSALGMDIVRAVFADQARAPLLIVNEYVAPALVDDNTLVILSSYSGTTEETITVARQLLEASAADVTTAPKIAVVTTGGDLRQLMEEHNWPGFVIDPKNNPCGQPRIAVGYAVVALLRLLSAAGIITVTDAAIDDIIHYLNGNRELLRDAAQEAVKKIGNNIPLIIGSEFLLGNLHTIANQINENGKNFATWFAIPELNHHLLEGLTYPAAARQLQFVLVESQLYHERTVKRYQITRTVLDKQQLTYQTFIPTAPTKLLQAFEVLQWGSYLSFYLAKQNGIDPSPIPWVDFFKNALKK